MDGCVKEVYGRIRRPRAEAAQSINVGRTGAEGEVLAGKEGWIVSLLRGMLLQCATAHNAPHPRLLL